MNELTDTRENKDSRIIAAQGPVTGITGMLFGIQSLQRGLRPAESESAFNKFPLWPVQERLRSTDLENRGQLLKITLKWFKYNVVFLHLPKKQEYTNKADNKFWYWKLKKYIFFSKSIKNINKVMDGRYLSLSYFCTFCESWHWMSFVLDYLQGHLNNKQLWNVVLLPRAKAGVRIALEERDGVYLWNRR